MIRNQRPLRFASRTIFIGAALLVLMALVSFQSLPASANSQQARSGLKNFQHVFIIMMENTSYSSLIGNPNAPWINSAAKTYGLATSYYGVTHPSQPN